MSVQHVLCHLLEVTGRGNDLPAATLQWLSDKGGDLQERKKTGRVYQSKTRRGWEDERIFDRLSSLFHKCAAVHMAAHKQEREKR